MGAVAAATTHRPGAGTRRLTAGEVACWLVKTAAEPAGAVPGWLPGASVRLRRCLRRSYRLSLMAAGQRCVLWRSGPVTPGVHAVGLLAGGAQDGPGGPTVEVDLVVLTVPVARAELLLDPAFATAEVVRMPAGSNPSALTVGQLGAVLERLWPAESRAAGWDRC